MPMTAIPALLVPDLQRRFLAGCCLTNRVRERCNSARSPFRRSKSFNRCRINHCSIRLRHSAKR